ncbi:MAG TPA: tRNA-dihydrouridine synthase [Candidatus Paceibacterota bacterium]
MKNFWKELKKPIFVLAPMADVTDYAYRQVIRKYGKPDVFWTEFVSADGLAHPVAREKLLIDLKYSQNEHPIVAQIFGGKPENIKVASALCLELGFDGVDINMGCPDKSVEKQCAGAAMMRDVELAKKIIRAAKVGAESAGQGIPVSVKTRIGYNKNEIETWIPALLEEDLAVLTVHLRTRKEMSNVPAHWDVMKRIIEIRDEMKVETLILGNGDAVDLKDAQQKVKDFGCDGAMLGRAIFGNPWLFGKIHTGFLSLRTAEPNSSLQKISKDFIENKLKVMTEHTKLFEEMLGQYKNFAIMKKHYKAYVNGFEGAKELRMKLMEAENADQVGNIVNDFLLNLG